MSDKNCRAWPKKNIFGRHMNSPIQGKSFDLTNDKKYLAYVKLNIYGLKPELRLPHSQMMFDINRLALAK